MARIDIEALEDEWEEDHHLLAQRRRSDPLSQAAKERIEDYDPGRIVAVDKGHVGVLYEGEVLPARFSGAMRGTKVVVGDRVRAGWPVLSLVITGLSGGQPRRERAATHA